MKDNYNFIMLDLETGPDVESAKLIDDISDGSKLLPEALEDFKEYKKRRIEEEKEKVYSKNYKQQKTVDSHIEAIKDIDFKTEYIELESKQSEQVNKLAINHPFAFIKFATLIVHTNGKDKILMSSNFDNDKIKERKLIEKICKKVYNCVTGSEGKATHELVTFNGKHFDIPLLIERAGVTHAKVPYRWLERLTARGDRYGHYDMMEYRAYNNTPYNKLSLSKNLVLRYGEDFAKEEIDFSDCENIELVKYAIDESLKFSYWIKDHNGLDIPTTKEYLKYIDEKIESIFNKGKKDADAKETNTYK